MIKTAAKIILFCAVFALCGVRPTRAATVASEYEVKAAFLYNFIKFVEWPPKAFPKQSSPIIIGILGDDDPFLDPVTRINYLNQTVRDKMINGRTIVVERSDRIGNLKNCQLLFIAKSERNHMKEIFSSINGMNILTVGETDNFCANGGMINFYMQSEKVRFEINVSAAERASLRISSKLLSVAKIIPAQPR